MNKYILRYLSLAVLIIATGLAPAHAQNLLTNGDITAGAANWTTSCVNVECYGFESSYGGTSTTNHVAEIDDEACMHQDVCILPGTSYSFSMDASCRTSGGPNPCISHIKIMGLDGTSTPIVTYVDMDYTRTNTTFGLTPVTGIPGFTVGSGSGVAYLRVELTDNTPGYLTLGMIVDNITLLLTSGAPTLSGTSVTTCQNTPVDFSVTGVGPAGLSYAWDFGPGATPATSTAATPTAQWSTPGTKTVTVAVGNGACFSDTLTYSVTVNPAYYVDVFDTTCYHVPYTFHGMSIYTSGTYSYTISNPTGCDTIKSLHLFVTPIRVGNFYNTICNGDTVTFNGHVHTTTGDYADSFLTAGGCDSAAVLHLTVNPIPAPPVAISQLYCQFDAPAPLSVTGAGLVWYGPGTTAGYTTAPSVSTMGSDTLTYYVTQTLLGCVSDSAMVTVTVKPHPAPPAVRDTAYCEYQSIPSFSAIGSNLLWYSSATGGSGTTIAPKADSSMPVQQTEYVTQTVNGCESDRATINVNIIATPSFTVTAPRHIVCQYDSLLISFSGTTSTEISAYLWSFPPQDSLVSGSITTPSIDLKFLEPGKNTIFLTAVGPMGKCSAIDSITIRVDTPAVATISTPAHACVGDTVGLNLAYHSANAVGYAWLVDNVALNATTTLDVVTHGTNSGGPYFISWTKPGLHIIELNTMSTGGCISKFVSDTVQINKIPNSAFTYAAKGGTLCIEDSVLFTAVERDGQYAYSWAPADYFHNINEAVTWGKVNELAANVALTVSDAFGCKSTYSMKLSAEGCCSIYFPNAFTPGDHVNNIFRPINEGFHRYHEFVIKNRWGQTIFISNTDNATWDGSYNGIPQDVGVYYYYLKYDCGGNAQVQKGDVTLIR